MMTQMTTASVVHTSETDNHNAGHSHVMPLSLLFGTFLTLIGLTVITVTASKLSLGAAEIWVAMGIATVKAVLVAAYFMHLRYDKPFNALLILFSLVFAAIFVGLVLVDSENYQSDLGAYELQNQKEAPRLDSATSPTLTK